MKRRALSTAILTAAFGLVAACAQTPVQNVAVPAANDASAYRPTIAQKPDAPAGYVYGMQPQGGPGVGQPATGGGLTVSPNPSIENEDAFVAAYMKRKPQIMVWVNRTIQGDPLPKDGLNEVIRVEKTQSATGAVAVNNTNTYTGTGQNTSAGLMGSAASNLNVNQNNSSSFTSGGPANYTSMTTVRKPTDQFDKFGLSSNDYEMLEASVTQYFQNSGKVSVKDSEQFRAKIDREQVLRIENGDPAANRLLATERQADVLIRITAGGTLQSTNGQAIRLIAKAVSTSDAQNLGTAFVDMPLPMSKPNINAYTRYLTSQLMRQMAIRWAQPPEFDPVEVRIYKAATIDDSGKIASWIKKAPGVTSVDIRNATGGSTTSYAVVSVGFAGAPWDLYEELKDGVGMSTGLKAVDLSNNTINLEITGPMNLVTTTRHVESTTTVETRTTEDRRVDTVTPATQQ